MAGRNVKVGNLTKISGEVNIAAGDIYKGYTAGQVSVLIKQITTSYQPKPFDGHCPYKGLDIFEEEDADLFFGRERLVEYLISRVKTSRTTFITGPSGSGKSSLMRAGLIHALREGSIKGSGRWLYETISPGRDPIKELSLAFSRLKSPELASYFLAHINNVDILSECAESVLSGRKDQRFILFIDQFEEVFTQVNQESERQTFINMLAHAGAVENGRVIVLFAMRSDFISNCATYPELNSLLNKQFVQIGAMQPDELVSAIALPAMHVGLPIEDELIARIINDMKGEPGALPLMQFALKELFEAGQSAARLVSLRLKDYLDRGGIQQMLARHADDAFSALNPEEQELAQSIFSSLIEIGRGTQDARRTAQFDELIPAGATINDVMPVIGKLADARLIITDQLAGKDTVTISHEKLIDAWPWLQKLVNDNRDVIALQHEIAQDAKEWHEHDRDKSYLYTGARFTAVQERINTRKILLTSTSAEFVNAGVVLMKQGRRAQMLRRAIAIVVAIIGLVIISPIIIKEVAIFQAKGDLISIPAGSMIFGTNNPAYNALGYPKQQTVELSAFLIGKYEISNWQYSLCIKYANCTEPMETMEFLDPAKRNYPIVYVTYPQAEAYCRWVGQRLPTQYEWERAARSSGGAIWPWGNADPAPDTANMPWGNFVSDGLRAVNSNPKGATREGVYNLIGNAAEWTSSIISDQNGGAIDGCGCTNAYAQYGGGWNFPITDISAFNISLGTVASSDVGFRCAADAQ